MISLRKEGGKSHGCLQLPNLRVQRRSRRAALAQGHRAVGQTVLILRVVRRWNRDPQRSWNLHPWRYLALDWTCPRQPALSRVGLETCRGPFQLKLSAFCIPAHAPPLLPSPPPACTCPQASEGAQRAPRPSPTYYSHNFFSINKTFSS